MKYKRAI